MIFPSQGNFVIWTNVHFLGSKKTWCCSLIGWSLERRVPVVCTWKRLFRVRGYDSYRVMLQVGMVSDKAGVNRFLKAWLVIRVVLGGGSSHLLLRAHTELKIRKSLQERSSAIAAAYLWNQFLCWQENRRKFRVRSREWECGRDRYHLGAVGVRTWSGWVKGTVGHEQPELEQRWTAGRPGLLCGTQDWNSASQCHRVLQGWIMKMSIC